MGQGQALEVPDDSTITVEKARRRKVEASDIAREPQDLRETEAYRQAVKNFNAYWDREDTVIDMAAPEIKQVRVFMEAHLAEVFGGGYYKYTVGMFTEEDIPGMRTIGYQVLTKSLFPDGSDGKPTMNDSIARSLHCFIHVDGTIRWGRSGEILLCAIKNEKRELHLENVRKLAKKNFERALPQGTVDADKKAAQSADFEEKGYAEGHDIAISREVVKAPRPGAESGFVPAEGESGEAFFDEE